MQYLKYDWQNWHEAHKDEDDSNFGGFGRPLVSWYEVEDERSGLAFLVSREILTYQGGTILKYDLVYWQDEHGGITDELLHLYYPDAPLLQEIPQSEFEEVWLTIRANNEGALILGKEVEEEHDNDQ